MIKQSLRELTNIFQGICMIKQGEYNVFADIVKVWIHEFARVISDRFFTTPELEVYENILREVVEIRTSLYIFILLTLILCFL